MTSNLIETIENVETLNRFQKNRIRWALEEYFEDENLKKQLEERTGTKDHYTVEYHSVDYAIVSVTPTPTFDGKPYPYTAFIKKDETWTSVHCNYETFEETFLAAMAYKLEGPNYMADRYAGQILGLINR